MESALARRLLEGDIPDFGDDADVSPPRGFDPGEVPRYYEGREEGDYEYTGVDDDYADAIRTFLARAGIDRRHVRNLYIPHADQDGYTMVAEVDPHAPLPTGVRAGLESGEELGFDLGSHTRYPY
jgi:hypothetical protein